MDFSLPAVKAALHRGQARLRELAAEPDDMPQPELTAAERDRLGAYVAHFNARDFDAVRAIARFDDVRLDLVSRTRINGKAEVSRYFGNSLARVADWHLAPGLVEGRPAMPGGRSAGKSGAAPKYFILLRWSAGPGRRDPGFSPRALH